jgi:uncharacterized protein
VAARLAGQPPAIAGSVRSRLDAGNRNCLPILPGPLSLTDGAASCTVANLDLGSSIKANYPQQGEFPMASNVETTKKGYEFFKRGDVPTLIKDLVDDNCIWIAPGPQDKLPWAGRFKGKQEIANLFAQVAQNLHFTEFEPRDMIERGDTVVVIGTSSHQVKKTGKTVRNEWVHVFRYSQGKMVFFQEYIDTAAEVLGMS